jgi:dolichyl-phosphate beta-glucosyltransferase
VTTTLDPVPDLSIVIPAYNEEARIGPFLDSVGAYARIHPLLVEVVVVDDGSTDGTLAVVEARRPSLPLLRTVALPENRGKGAAVRAGLAAARGGLRAFLDADGSTPVGELDRLLAVAREQPESVVIGSLAPSDARVDVGQVWFRQLVGRLGNAVIRMLVLRGIHDTQRGCKLLPAAACDRVLRFCEVDGWAFDVELLALATRAGHPIVEVGISWHHEPGSKVRPSSYVETLRDVVRVRRRLRHLEKASLVGETRVDTLAR